MSLLANLYKEANIIVSVSSGILTVISAIIAALGKWIEGRKNIQKNPKQVITWERISQIAIIIAALAFVVVAVNTTILVLRPGGSINPSPGLTTVTTAATATTLATIIPTVAIACCTANSADWWNEVKNTPSTNTWDMTKAANGWDISPQCQLRTDGYHVSSSDGAFPQLCFNSAIAGADMAMKADFSIVAGDSGGIIWHAQGSPLNLNAQMTRIRFGQDGTLDSYINPGDGTHGVNPIPSQSNALIHTGLGVKNELAIVVHGTTFAVFINGLLVTTAQDSTTHQGAIGLMAAMYKTSTVVVYTNVTYWSLVD